MKVFKKTVPQSQFLSLVYHDLFDFPLTQEELNYWSVGTGIFPKMVIGKTGPFFFLSGRQELVIKRSGLTQEAERKYRIAQKASTILARIPSILLVGITGGLAMGNTKEDDDIDLLVITEKGTLWCSRLVGILLLGLFGIKVRKAGDTDFKDKLCLNMWLDEVNLKLQGREEIYTAHELLQTRVLFDRGLVWKKILDQNRWTAHFFPFAFKSESRIKGLRKKKQRTLLLNVFKFFEIPARFLQLFYMHKKQGGEIVEKGKVYFHPNKWNQFIPEVFLSRLEKLSKGEKVVEHSQQIAD